MRCLGHSIVLVICVYAKSYCQQDTWSINGQVRSRDDQPLEDVLVNLVDLNQVKTTDSSGYFEFNAVPSGSYTIVVHRLGFSEITQSLDLVKDLDLNFVLELAGTLEAIEIHGHREEILSSQPVQTLEGLELDKRKGETLGANLTALNGVNMLQTGATIAKPVIHGVHSNRVLILNHGIRQEGHQWGAEHAPEIDPFIAQKLTVIKGASGVQYGSDAIGGVVLVEPPELPTAPKLAGEVNLIGMSNGRSGVASALLEGGHRTMPGFSWRAQGTLKRAGNLKAPNYYLDNTGVGELNFSGNLGYVREKIGMDLYFSRFDTKLGILSASHVGNPTDLADALESQNPPMADHYQFSYAINRPFQDVSHNLLRFSSFLKLKEQLRVHLTYGYQLNHRQEFDRVRSSITQTSTAQLDLLLKTHSMDLHLEHRLSESFTGNFGIDALTQSNVFEGRQLIPNFRLFRGGLYLIEHFIKPRYEVESGVRYDHHRMETFRSQNGVIVNDEFSYNNFSGVLGGSYKITPKLEGKLNLASAWRAPNVNELFSNGVHQGVASYEVGDPELVPEKAFNQTADLSYSASQFTANLSLYNNIITDFIYLEPQAPETVLTIRGAFPLFEYKQVDASFKGIDVGFEWQLIPNLEWRLKGSLVRAQNKNLEEPLVLIPADRLRNSVSYRIPTIGKFGNNFLSLGHSFVAEQSRVPAESDFAPPPPAYNLLQLEAGTETPVGAGTIRILFEIKNLANTTYRDYLNRFRYFADEPGRNLILRIKYSF